MGPLLLQKVRMSDGVHLEKWTLNKLKTQMGHIAYVYPDRSRVAFVISSSSFPRILPYPIEGKTYYV